MKCLQTEITTAKKIFRDPNLTRSIGRAYNELFESRANKDKLVRDQEGIKNYFDIQDNCMKFNFGF